MNRIFSGAAAISVLVALIATFSPAQESRPESFCRFVSKSRSVGSLETAVATYVDRKSGEVVRLVAAVHVGDPAYYHAVQSVLDDADLVLFEGVSGEPTPDMTAVARLQVALGRFLGLGFQKDHVAYDRAHFIRADLTIAEIERRLAEKGERLIPGGNFLRAFGPMLAGILELAGKSSASSRSGDDPMNRTTKLMVAKILGDPNAARNQVSQAWDEVVIRERNKKALEVLDGLRGKDARSFAIFYGAAHLADMEARLIERGFERKDVRWIVAWRMGGEEPETRASAGIGRQERRSL